MLPEGDHGIRAPAFGSVQEEHNMVAAGRTATVLRLSHDDRLPVPQLQPRRRPDLDAPEQVTYTPGGRKIKNPRACPKLWRTADGQYLLWFHNHSGRILRGRNPAWITGGRPRRPHPLVAAGDPALRPDAAIAHELSRPGRAGRPLLGHRDAEDDRPRPRDRPHAARRAVEPGARQTVARRGLVLDLDREQIRAGNAKLPEKLDLRQTGGLTLDAWLKLDDLAAGQVILDNRDAAGSGFALTTAADGALRIELTSDKVNASWDSDPGVLRRGKLHHVVCTVDAGPRIVTFAIDGVLCDGGAARQFGWGRYDGELTELAGSGRLQLAPLKGELQRVRLYSRYLRTSEAVANFHAGQ